MSSHYTLDVKNLHYSLATKFYDKHTLYIDSGAIPKDKLEKIINDAINETVKFLKKEYKLNINPEHKLNLVTNKDNQSLGYAYLWVADEKLYNICSGLNPDSSERIEQIPDPNWKPIIKDVTTAMENLKSPSSLISSNIDWAEIEDDIDEFEQKAPLINVQLESLIQFQSYKYNTTELVDAERIIKYSISKKSFGLFSENIAFDEKQNDDDKWKLYENLLTGYKKNNYTENEFYTAVIAVLSNTDNHGIQVEEFTNMLFDIVDEIIVNVKAPAEYTIELSGAYVLNVAEDEKRNELFALIKCRNIPTSDQIRSKFTEFMINKSKYPIVMINEQKTNVRVIFDDKTRDAQFVLYMTRKVEFTTPRCLFLFNVAKAQQKQQYTQNNKQKYNKY